MKKLEKLKLMKINEKELTANDLNLLKGGGGGDDPYFGGTLDTITVTPNGNKNDGYDPGCD